MSQPGKSILLVDDDQEIRELLQTYLSRAGFQVRTVGDGAGFRLALQEQPADLVILDVMLPDEDGFSLCRWVREHQRLAQMPVIMLTASSDEADRVIGLELGADDYVVKPFSSREVISRMRAILRRAGTAAPTDQPYRTDGLEIDFGVRRVTLAGDEVALSRKEFDLLSALAQNAGEVVTREDLMAKVWDVNWFGSTKTLDVHIRALRKKLGDSATEPRYISTVRGVGFRMAEPESGAS